MKKPKISYAKDKGSCRVKGCRNHRELVWMEFPVCSRCWERHCDENDKLDFRKEGTLLRIQED